MTYNDAILMLSMLQIREARTDGEKDAINKAIDALQYIECGFAWHPADEYPEEQDEYMVTWVTDGVKMLEIAEWDGDDWILDHIKGAYPDARVTAWQDLPEVYDGQ